MKKSLFAVAALSAIAGAAQAQSSVTVYGILDVGYIGENTKVLAPAVTSATTVATPGITPAVVRSGSNGQLSTTGNQFGAGAQQTNRLGFKGTEDLGGGASAFFTIELGLTPQSEQTINTGATQNRQTFVGLKKNGIGAASIGTQYTPIHTAVGATDPGQQNQVMGNVIYGAASGFDTKLAPVQTLANSTDNYTVRTNNMLKLQSDRLAGFTVTGVLVANNTNSTQVSNTNSTSSGVNAGTNTGYYGGLNNQSGWGLGVNYEWQKLLVTANYQAFTSKNPIQDTWSYAAKNYSSSAANISSTITAVGAPVAWNQSSGGTNVQDNQGYVGATYDFGILKAYAQWATRKVSSQEISTNYVKRNAQQIGVRSFITPTIEAWASAGNGRYNAYGASSPTANFTGYQLGSNYWLSKRTNLYAIYGGFNTSTVTITNGGASGSGATNGNYSANANNYAIGVRHTF
ncbi:porin [Polynucleobacter tropicus]|uniref:Porin n=1 Tax=Polynucleobacter tropicus TaxID=1743174 RepID=A0A6M9PYM0_9BURK|nr:porin [Polynucleobacter tropicus]QKM63865.1 porin [Polynucleobacter tropicus]